jgi:hypothetical protein
MRAERSACSDGPISSFVRWPIAHAEDDLATELGRNQCSPIGCARGKVDGAIDGIDDPAASAIASSAAFFAAHAIVRPFSGKMSAEFVLYGEVRRGGQASITLGPLLQLSSEVRSERAPAASARRWANAKSSSNACVMWSPTIPSLLMRTTSTPQFTATRRPFAAR